MGMNQVHDNGKPLFMCLPYQVFQVDRCSKSRGNSKEVGYMVAKGGIIGMLGNGHQLDRVVAGIFYVWDQGVCKLYKSAHLLCFLCHSNMTLIDEQFTQFADVEGIAFPVEFCGGK